MLWAIAEFCTGNILGRGYPCWSYRGTSMFDQIYVITYRIMGEKKDTQVVQVAKTATKITAQARWFPSSLCTLPGLSCEAVRTTTTSSTEVLPALRTGLLCLVWALAWLERGD